MKKTWLSFTLFERLLWIFVLSMFALSLLCTIISLFDEGNLLLDIGGLLLGIGFLPEAYLLRKEKTRAILFGVCGAFIVISRIVGFLL